MRLLNILNKIEKDAQPLSDNAMFFITLRRDEGVWHFTDKARGLVKEPLVAGIPKILEELIEDEGLPIKKAVKGLRVVFAGRKFPGSQLELRRGKKESGGAWYSTEDELEGWLCPALLKFFQKAPPKLYCSVAIA
jgi:hypothetical protein